MLSDARFRRRGDSERNLGCCPSNGESALAETFKRTHAVFVNAVELERASGVGGNRLRFIAQQALIMTETNAAHPVLLYDGLCGFCNKGVQRILRYDKRKTMFFAALQSDYGKSILTRHPELAGIDSLVFVEPLEFAYLERVFVRSDALLRVAGYLGGLWKFSLAAYIIPRSIRDYLYDQFAKRRYRWFGKYDTCMLPPPEVRARFLDTG
jgi:predicted DCC family thiol-disulfide oxidoreductase YuxK